MVVMLIHGRWGLYSLTTIIISVELNNNEDEEEEEDDDLVDEDDEDDEDDRVNAEDEWADYQCFLYFFLLFLRSLAATFFRSSSTLIISFSISNFTAFSRLR